LGYLAATMLDAELAALARVVVLCISSLGYLAATMLDAELAALARVVVDSMAAADEEEAFVANQTQARVTAVKGAKKHHALARRSRSCLLASSVVH
jgi:hypothetical protein